MLHVETSNEIAVRSTIVKGKGTQKLIRVSKYEDLTPETDLLVEYDAQLSVNGNHRSALEQFVDRQGINSRHWRMADQHRYGVVFISLDI